MLDMRTRFIHHNWASVRRPYVHWGVPSSFSGILYLVCQCNTKRHTFTPTNRFDLCMCSNVAPPAFPRKIPYTGRFRKKFFECLQKKKNQIEDYQFTWVAVLHTSVWRWWSFCLQRSVWVEFLPASAVQGVLTGAFYNVKRTACLLFKKIIRDSASCSVLLF